MNSIATTAIIGLVLIGLTATAWLHHHAARLARDKELAVRQQGEQIAALLAEQQSSSNRLAARSSTNNPINELAQLRQRVAALHQKTNDLGQQIQSNLQAHVHPRARTEPPHTEEYWKQLHELAGGRTQDVMVLGRASMEYAMEHQGLFPTNTDQVASYLQPGGMPLTGTNQFDFVYQGTLNDLKGIPPQAVVVMRDRQTWTAPSGKSARVYGMADGTGQIVESDDNFKSWEAEHVLPSTETDP
jgi:hypothetical protein